MSAGFERKEGHVSYRRFKLSDHQADAYGLSGFDLDRLGRYVVLAGANGSGKSRILTALRTSVDQVDNANGTGGFRVYEKLIEDLERGLIADSPDGSSIEQLRAQMESVRPTVETDFPALVKPIWFVPQSTSDVPIERAADPELQSSYENSSSGPTTAHGPSAVYYLLWLIKRGISLESPRYAGDTAAQKFLARRDEFLALATELVGAKFDIDSAGTFLFNGKHYQAAPLSSGQKVLLQLAVSLHAYGKNLAEAVLVLDEPETHLHPSILVNVLERLEVLSPRGQIWIATHSVPLIAYVVSKQPNAIYCVHDGKVEYAERDPERVLAELLGDETGIAQLHALTGLPSDLAIVNYATQCLTNPQVAGHRGADPQEAQMVGLITGVPGVARVLDVGAGKGRLLDALGHHFKENLITRVDYVALDELGHERMACEQTINAHYRKSRGRWFESFGELETSEGSESFDLAVLCNTLHEIEPEKWSETLLDIARCLKPDGQLLLVEDLEIKVGELPHPGGFLVLDTADIELLCPGTEPIVPSVHPRRGNLKAHPIPRSRLLRVTEESVRAAIGSVLRWSSEQIRHVREEKNPSYRAALRYSFLLQQNVNASLYLGEAKRTS